MIDNAEIVMKTGATVAAERMAGINDNMCSPHYHEFYEFYYLESGERYHLTDDHLYLLSPGQFIIFKPHQLHYSYGDENIPFSRLLVYFDKNMIFHNEVLIQMGDISGAYQLNQKKTEEIYYFMNQILNEQENRHDFFTENMVNLVNQLVIRLLRSKSDKKLPQGNNLITEIISYINLNYMNKITLQQLAEYFYVSQWHLCREFKFYTNDTIIQYLNKIRVIHSQKMLIEDEKKIIDISSDSGFNCLTHFERVFKQITEVTPSEYRKKNR